MDDYIIKLVCLEVLIMVLSKCVLLKEEIIKYEEVDVVDLEIVIDVLFWEELKEMLGDFFERFVEIIDCYLEGILMFLGGVIKVI